MAHVHEKAIKAWAEGKQIKRWDELRFSWVEDPNPHFDPKIQYSFEDEEPHTTGYIQIDEKELKKHEDKKTILPFQNEWWEDNTGYNKQVIESITSWAKEVMQSNIVVYDRVKLFELRDSYHIGSQDTGNVNVKYTFDKETRELISVELIK